MRFSRGKLLEQGWLLAEIEDVLATRWRSWRTGSRGMISVSHRLALVELLPETIQQQVREGK